MKPPARSQPRLGPAVWPVLPVLAVVIAVSLLLRTQNLLSLPIFTDEAIYLHWASDIWEQRTLRALLIPIVDDGKQPLFMWIAGGLMQLVEDPLVAGRLVSAIAGITGTIGMYLAGRSLAGARAGLIAALLHATVPFAVIFDRMALVDGLLAMTAIWALYLAVTVVTTPLSTRKTLVAGAFLGIVLGAAAWTKTTALFILPFPLLTLPLVRGRTDLRRAGLGLAAAYGLLGMLALPLALVPGAANLVNKVDQFAAPAPELLTIPASVWASNAEEYWEWVRTYLPAPLYLLVLLAVPWGLVVWRRQTLVLLACWAVSTVPLILTARLLFTTRYVLPSAIPLLLLTAILLDWIPRRVESLSGAGTASRTTIRARLLPSILSLTLVLAVVYPSIAFDLRLIENPGQAGLARSDRWQYMDGWPAGYGFKEVLDAIRERVSEHDGNTIILSDNVGGLPYDGLALYLKSVPRAYHYVERLMLHGGTGIVEVWRPHNVPLLIVGHDGRIDLDSFERNVPEADRIGVFKNPFGEHAFRLYEIDLPRLKTSHAAASSR